MKAGPFWALGGVLLLLAVAGVVIDRYSSTQVAPRDDSISLAALLAITLPDAEGRAQSIGQWQGKILVVNFWATWCAPCIEEMPMLNEFQRRNAANDVQVVGIAADNAAKVGEYARNSHIAYPLLVDADGALEFSRRLGNSTGALPFTAVFSAEGRRLLARAGPTSNAELERVLRENAAK